MVDIVLNKIPPVADNQGSAVLPKPVKPQKRVIKNRRRNPSDRRKSVRDGIVVTLSGQEERRSGVDRRKVNP